VSIIITDLCKTFDDNEVLKNVNITLKDNSIYLWELPALEKQRF